MSKKNKKASDLDSLISESLENIRQDRAMASTLLIDLMEVLKKDNSKHQSSGPVAAKYLETLQRSNEQLVKINTLLHKKASISNELTSADKDHLYDIINSAEANTE